MRVSESLVKGTKTRSQLDLLSFYVCGIQIGDILDTCFCPAVLRWIMDRNPLKYLQNVSPLMP